VPVARRADQPDHRRVQVFRLRTVLDFAITGASDRFAMPAAARVVHVAEQHARPTMWVELDPDEPPVQRTFEIFGTGHPVLDPTAVYVGTCVGQPFVWHIYEVADRSLPGGDMPAQAAATADRRVHLEYAVTSTSYETRAADDVERVLASAARRPL
jgi:hypothetical protein